MNTYGYVGGNPISYEDPLGLIPPGWAKKNLHPWPKEPYRTTLTRCQMRWLNENYGELGGFIADLFNLQQFLGPRPDLWQNVGNAVELGVEKGVATEGVGLLGKTVAAPNVAPNLIGWSKISSATLGVASMGLTTFATTAVSLAVEHCQNESLCNSSK